PAAAGNDRPGASLAGGAGPIALAPIQIPGFGKRLIESDSINDSIKYLPIILIIKSLPMNSINF
ncbi:hypothetical protein, partial [Burkholderia anthina]|uniref:hypothetical protein n=1 Tax=Burkholderia anthina TaxID=179879 RepID=UPI001ABB8795